VKQIWNYGGKIFSKCRMGISICKKPKIVIILTCYGLDSTGSGWRPAVGCFNMVMKAEVL
jgi:hypothetical protein